MSLNKIIFIVGPTAIGKSDIAYDLARPICSPVISCDSMQVYREINIANNKPSQQVLSEIDHYMVDIKSVEDLFDVAQFNELANTAVIDIFAKHQIPIVVGGTGLYMKVLLDGLFVGGDPDLKLREKLKLQADKYGKEYMYQELMNIDPQSAKHIHPNDLKKVIRALEVYHLEGKPISQKQKNTQGWWRKYDITLIALTCNRERLYERINERVDQMFEQGLIEEIRQIKNLNLSQTALGIIGIKEVLAHLKGEYDGEQAKYLMKLNTRHLAKRQLTWFRKEERLDWIDLDQFKSIPDIVTEISRIAGLR